MTTRAPGLDSPLRAADGARAGAETSAATRGSGLQVGVAALMLGFAALYLRGSVPGWLGALRHVSVGFCSGLELYAGVVALAGVAQLWPRTRGALLVCAAAALAHTAASATQAATPWLAVVSGATRALAPLAAWPALRSRAAAPILRVAAAATFAGHGLQALQQDPRFAAYLDAAFGLVGTTITPGANTLLLRAIGSMDLTFAALTLLLAPRPVLRLMTGWGFATAAVRIVHGGISAWPETAIRLVHGFAPWALLRLKRTD